MRGRTGHVLLLFTGAGLFGIMLLYITYTTPPTRYAEPYRGNKEVSGAYALYYVRKLSSPYFQGRAPGTPGGDRAARYIAARFRDLGLKPGGDGGTYFQTVTGKRFHLQKEVSRWKPKATGTATLLSDNVLGYLGAGDGRKATKTIIVSAHYDHLGPTGEGFFPGANDNASGVAVLLETARVLKNMPPGNDTRILFAAWTLEEEGLIGSTHFAARYPLSEVKAVINLDSLGNGGSREFLVWTQQPGDPLLKRLAEAARRAGVRLNTRVLPAVSPHTSDHRPFGEKGIPAVTITSPDWLEENHTFQDTADKVMEEKLKRATVLVISLVEQLVY